MKDYEALSKKHFDGQAAEYDQRDTYYYSQNGKISCRDIAAKVNSVPYEALLDVGCGTGFLIDILAKQKSARYCGVDLSDGMIRVAKSKKIPDAEFTVGSADRLPYPDESFDIVACSQSFHHYPYPEKAMLEAKRVLKPGGLYILSDTGIGGVGTLHKRLLAGMLPACIGGGIGQSRLCMYLLRKAHIGEIQSSLWPDDMRAACAAAGIDLV